MSHLDITNFLIPILDILQNLISFISLCLLLSTGYSLWLFFQSLNDLLIMTFMVFLSFLCFFLQLFRQFLEMRRINISAVGKISIESCICPIIFRFMKRSLWARRLKLLLPRHRIYNFLLLFAVIFTKNLLEVILLLLYLLGLHVLIFLNYLIWLVLFF